MAFGRPRPRKPAERFRITYTDPETREERMLVREFEETSGIVTSTDGSTRNVGPISARDWAEDLAYSVADKGPYKIEPVGSWCALTPEPVILSPAPCPRCGT